jgi:chromosome segregation ATPase
MAEAEQRGSELSALQRQHESLQRTYEAAVKEIDALHAGRTSAAKRAEEALAELVLVRETQQALTLQVNHCSRDSFVRVVGLLQGSCQCVLALVH